MVDVTGESDRLVGLDEFTGRPWKRFSPSRGGWASAGADFVDHTAWRVSGMVVLLGVKHDDAEARTSGLRRPSG
jgi:hypothetical protein